MRRKHIGTAKVLLACFFALVIIIVLGSAAVRGGTETAGEQEETTITKATYAPIVKTQEVQSTPPRD